MEIPTSQVVPNPYQPRKSMNSEAIVELAASIKAEGFFATDCGSKIRRGL